MTILLKRDDASCIVKNKARLSNISKNEKEIKKKKKGGDWNSEYKIYYIN